MNTDRRRCAFTLIEVLIVVVIMAVLAATIIPQFSSSTKDAKESSLKFNMRTMRSQIELYKVHHLSNYPDDLGAAATGYLPQLTSASDTSGATGAAGANFPFGPYMDEIPPNPFDGENQVVAVAAAGAKPLAAVGADGGWQYDSTTGAVWPNNTDFDYSSL